MGWWNTTVPLWQVMGIVSVYVIYKEVVKLTLKSIVKRVRKRSVKPTQIPLEDRGQADGEIPFLLTQVAP